MKQYDVVVIGAGTGGQTAAYDLGAAGLDVALVDDAGRLGGTCALAGCQPKKWFYEAAEIVAKSRHLRGIGIRVPAEADWAAVWRQKQDFVNTVPDDTRSDLHAAGIAFFHGTAFFLDAHTLRVEDHVLEAPHVVIATGAVPAAMPIAGAEFMATSTQFLERETLPPRILFVGGGFVSFEFAHAAARIGPERRRIRILEAAPRPLRMFDRDMVDLLCKASADDGIEILTDVRIARIRRCDNAYQVLTEEGRVYSADLVVHGASRVPRVEGLRLDDIGVAHTARGIKVTHEMRTTAAHIFAVGDCADTIALARVADYEAHVAARNILAARRQGAPVTVGDRSVPSLLFTYPQCAMVGDTEEMLREKGVSHTRSMSTALSWPTYRRVGMRHAGYKILMGDDQKILGAHVVSDNAGGLVDLFRQAIDGGMTVPGLFRESIMTPYPTRQSDLIYMLRPFLGQESLPEALWA